MSKRTRRWFWLSIEDVDIIIGLALYMTNQQVIEWVDVPIVPGRLDDFGL